MSAFTLEETRAEVKHPADFEAFWAGVKAELDAVPADWERLVGAGGETATHDLDAAIIGTAGKVNVMRTTRNMILFYRLATLLVVGALLLSCKGALADSPTPNTRLNEAQVIRIARTFCQKVSNTITVPGTATYTKLPEINPGSYWQSRWEVEFPGQAQVEVVDATGIVCDYGCESYYIAHRNDNDPPGEAIPQQEAIQYAKQAINATGQSEPVQFEHAEVFQMHNHPLASNHHWFVEWYRTSHGVPYRDQYANVLMDAQTGEIRGLVLMFPTAPLASAVQNFRQEEAISAAASIVINQGIEESASHTDTHLEIVRTGPALKTPRLAWISTFVVDGHWRQVYLDTETGEVLGGGRDNGPAGRGPVTVAAPAPAPIMQALKTVHEVYLRRAGPVKGDTVRLLKLHLSIHPPAAAALIKTPETPLAPPSEASSQHLVLVSRSGAIGVYSYYPKTGLLGSGTDWVIVSDKFQSEIQHGTT